MGLDITAFEHVALVEEQHEREDEDGNVCYERVEYGGQGHISVYNEKSFPHSLGSILNDRCYTATGEQFRFHAGSYSGYNIWREELSKHALGVSPGRVWNDPGAWADRPFYELINFSDCEGVIGPEVSARLAQDFRDHRDDIRAALESAGAWMAVKYDEWQRAFELASVDGLVDFH